MYRMVSIAEAQEIVLKAINPLPSVSLGLSDAVGYILGEDVIAREPLPPFPASIKVQRFGEIELLEYHPKLGRASCKYHSNIRSKL